MTSEQLRAKWKISRKLMDNLIRQPGFPAVKVGKKKILIPADKLQAWIDHGGLTEGKDCNSQSA